jgi:hypothetical protein
VSQIFFLTSIELIQLRPADEEIESHDRGLENFYSEIEKRGISFYELVISPFVPLPQPADASPMKLTFQ